MPNDTMQTVADLIVQRAKAQGYLRPRDIRLELADAGLPEEKWQEIVTLARDCLHCQQGRYYHVDNLTEPQKDEQTNQRVIRETVRGLIRRYQQAKTHHERRFEDRFEFVQPVQIETEDGRAHTLLSRDVSTTGLRLIATQGFLGQKIKVTLPQAGEGESCEFMVRILWTCAVADGLYENGGAFVELL